MALTIRAREAVHRQWHATQRRGRTKAARRRRTAVEALIGLGLDRTAAYSLAATAALLGCEERSKPRRRGDR